MTNSLLLAAFAALATSTAIAQDGPALVKGHNCAMCHGNGIGGKFEAIAAKYAGNADASTTLAAVIRNGAKGGAVAMPPTAVSDAEARAMASYILSLGK